MASIPSDYDYRGEFPRRRMFARLSRIDQLGDGPRARISYEFDAVDADLSIAAISDAIQTPEITKPFALLRIVTTPNRFRAVTGTELPRTGQWYRFQLAPREEASGPILFHAQLGEGGYNVLSRGVLAEGDMLFSDEEPASPPQPLGASTTSTYGEAIKVAEACDFPLNGIATAKAIRAILSRFQMASYIVVRDVGQASFCTAYDQKKSAIFHYDAGWPLVFNGRTAPKWFSLPHGKHPIILSHWDFDHLLSFYKFPQIRNSKWIVPIQKLGPGAKRIANILAAKGNLLGWNGKALKGPHIELYRCTGGPTDANGSGIAVKLDLKGKKVALLVGDANYSQVPIPTSIKFDGLAVTHHGALFEGRVPLPIRRGTKCAVSVGRGNVYQHPKSAALKKHERRGWVIQTTSGVRGYPRGNRILR